MKVVKEHSEYENLVKEDYLKTLHFSHKCYEEYYNIYETAETEKLISYKNAWKYYFKYQYALKLEHLINLDWVHKIEAGDLKRKELIKKDFLGTFNQLQLSPDYLKTLTPKQLDQRACNFLFYMNAAINYAGVYSTDVPEIVQYRLDLSKAIDG